MPIKTNNTVCLLNFNDVNNPYKDECGNTWRTTGNTHLEYDSYINKYAIVFNRSTADSLRSTINWNMTSRDFTVDGTFYMNSDSSNSYCPRIFEFCINAGSRIQFIKRDQNFELCLDIWSNSNSFFTKYTTEQYKDVWTHFAITYRKSTQVATVFMNGKKKIESKISPLSDFNPNFTNLCLGDSNSMARSLSGKIGYFRIENSILYNTEFDPKVIIINKIDDKSNHNTKRLFSFNYDYNTLRKTKWNNKVNMYVMGPRYI